MTQAVHVAIMPACLLEAMEASGQIPPNTFKVRMPQFLLCYQVAPETVPSGKVLELVPMNEPSLCKLSCPPQKQMVLSASLDVSKEVHWLFLKLAYNSC